MLTRRTLEASRRLLHLKSQSTYGLAATNTITSTSARSFTPKTNEKLKTQLETTEKPQHSEPSEPAQRAQASLDPDRMTRKEWRERLNNTTGDTTYLKGTATPKQDRNYQRKHTPQRPT